MGLRVAVQQQQRRAAATGHQVDAGALGLDAALREAREELGHLCVLPYCPLPPPGTSEQTCSAVPVQAGTHAAGDAIIRSARIEIDPVRIVLFGELDFPSSLPTLD